MRLFNNLIFLGFLILLGCQTKDDAPIIHVKEQVLLFDSDRDSIVGDCVTGDCYSGEGKYVIKGEEGYQYEGGFGEGRAHGQGRFNMPNGFYKEGTWKNGRLVNGKEYNAFDSTLYNGGFVVIDIDGFKFDVPHGLGTIQFGYNSEQIKIEHDSGEVVSIDRGTMQFEYNSEQLKVDNDSGEIVSINGFYTTSYTKDARNPCFPIGFNNKNILHQKPQFKAQYQKNNRLPNFSKVRLFGKPTPHGVVSLNRREATYGRMIRALRFQNITREVEKRYGLPNNVILAMIMIESSGILHLPNGSNDGGIGLAHMQGIVAEEFGMNTVCHKNCGIRCFKHGRYLRRQIYKQKFQDAALFPIDDRFQPILNLDAVGRMLAYYERRYQSPSTPPIKRGIYLYAGKYNAKGYWAKVKYYMSELNNPKTIRSLERAFNWRNRKSGITYEQYLSAFHKMNYNYGLEEYMGLCNINPVKPIPNPNVIPPKDDFIRACYVVVVVATADQLRATSIVKEFRTKGYPLADYIWLPDYPNSYRSYTTVPQLYQVYLRVSKTKEQIEVLEQEIKRNLPQFSDAFIKEIR